MKKTNILPTPKDPHKLDFKCSSIFLLMWDMMQRQLPSKTLDDLKDFNLKFNLSVDGVGAMGKYFGLQYSNGEY